MATLPRQNKLIETLLSLFVLVVLIGIGLAILKVQNKLNPGVANFVSQAISADTAAENQSTDNLTVPLPEGIAAMSPAERFSPDSLSDKINGKAELYLSAGFVGLQAQRFRLSDDPGRWFEVYIYDMGSSTNAFAVFSSQRRKDVEKIALTRHAYKSTNALFFAVGGQYLELIASVPDETLMAQLTAFAVNYVDHEQPKNLPKPEAANPADLFPKKGLNTESITLIAKDAFGFDRLDQVYTAQYNQADKSLTLYLSQRSSSEEAHSLVQAYRDFLIEFGGTVAAPAESETLARAVTIEILDAFEVIFSQGAYLGGVHMADDVDAAMTMAAMLNQHIDEMAAIP